MDNSIGNKVLALLDKIKEDAATYGMEPNQFARSMGYEDIFQMADATLDELESED